MIFKLLKKSLKTQNITDFFIDHDTKMLDKKKLFDYAKTVKNKQLKKL